MHNEARKIIGATGRKVIIVNPETGNIDWTFNDWGKKEKGEGPYWAHPVIHNGFLYLRHRKAFMVYDIKAKS
jgi:hypothetical protein